MSTLLTNAMIEEAFAKTGVDRKYFPQYEAEAKSYYEGLTKDQVFDVGDDEEDADEENYAEGSLDHADKYIRFYATEREKGHGHKWAHFYALGGISGDEVEYWINEVQFDDIKEKDRELVIHAQSINDNPVFVERFKKLAEWRCSNISEKADEYCRAYHKCVEEGKSETYAHAYAEALNDDPSDCEIYADAYELAKNHDMNDSDASMFGDCCTKAYANGIFLGNKDFFYTFGEEWQKEYYLKLWCQRLEDDNLRKLSDLEHQKYRDLLEYDIKCIIFKREHSYYK